MREREEVPLVLGSRRGMNLRLDHARLQQEVGVDRLPVLVVVEGVERLEKKARTVVGGRHDDEPLDLACHAVIGSVPELLVGGRGLHIQHVPLSDAFSELVEVRVLKRGELLQVVPSGVCEFGGGRGRELVIDRRVAAPEDDRRGVVLGEEKDRRGYEPELLLFRLTPDQILPPGNVQVHALHKDGGLG